MGLSQKSTCYKSNAQPQYVLFEFDEGIATNGTMGTETDPNKFGGWLRRVLQTSEQNK